MTQDKNVVYKITVNADDATATVRRLDGTIVATQVNVQSLRKEFGNFSVQVGRSTQVAADKFNTFNQSVKSAKIEQQGLSRATGGATTSVLELGRVISDAPYGIRGMANNISQLASNMLFTAQQVDGVTGKVIGFTGVLKQMGKVFMGPLGLLFVIQAAISALDYFFGSTKKAEEASKDFNTELKTEIRTLKLYEESLRDSNTTLEERVGILKGLSALDKDLAKSLKEAGDNQERLNELTEEYRKKKELELKLSETKAKLDEISLRYDEAALKVATVQLLLENARDNRSRIAYERKLNLAKGVEEEIRKEQDKTFEEYLILLSKLTDKDDPEGKRDKVKSVGAILTAEELEEARIKQAEQIDALFQDKFKLEQENAQHFIDLNKSVGEQIAADEAIINAKRAKEKDEFDAYMKRQDEIAFENKMKLLDAIGGGLQAMSQIAGEEAAAGKALAVASATIDTYAAIDGQLRAFSGSPIPGYAIAQAVATGLFGLAQVKKILEVKVPGGGGAGGSVPSVKESRTFDFNLVGSTGQNQLAQTIGGQVSQPIKAYVVGSEITNQQAFDNQIQGQVTIG